VGINSLFRARVAEAAVSKYRIVKAGVAAGTCVTAAAAADKLLGTSDDLDHAIGEVVDVAVGPVPFVVLGGAVAAGDPLTSDANGAAVVGAAGNRTIGFAETAGVAGDIIPYLRALGVL
jgi:hypothetical protein